MTTDDSYEIDMQMALMLQRHTVSFTLSPNLWARLSLQQALTWRGVEFNEASTPLVPDDLIGVYSFVVEPGIANHDLGYLLYIGKTDKQNFRARFKQYLGYQKESQSKRIHVQYMLREWPEHLKFYYAPVDNPGAVKATEDALLAAFKPPVPRAFPASMRQAVSLMRLLGG